MRRTPRPGWRSGDSHTERGANPRLETPPEQLELFERARSRGFANAAEVLERIRHADAGDRRVLEPGPIEQERRGHYAGGDQSSHRRRREGDADRRPGRGVEIEEKAPRARVA